MNTNNLFSNKILTQIAFGQYDVQLNFHNELSIMISHSLMLEGSTIKAIWTSDLNNIDVNHFLEFLNQKVLEAHFDKSNGLRIIFNEGVFFIPKPDNDFEYLHVMSEQEGIYIY